MSVMIATLCLNEMEHLKNLYNQHKDWPGLTKWVFVESADRFYAKASPHMVSYDGLSVDGTTDFLKGLADKDSRVQHIKYGFADHGDPAQGKVLARDAYMCVAEEIKPHWIVVLDADEFYCQADQLAIMHMMAHVPRQHNAFIFGHREIWRPPSIVDQPLFQYEVEGMLWSVPHVRFWRWVPGARYFKNHNYLEDAQGTFLNRIVKRFDRTLGNPECCHLAFASSVVSRAAKHRYYEARGEGVEDKRAAFVACRAAYETWQPGEKLPHGAKVLLYDGPIPEVFR